MTSDAALLRSWSDGLTCCVDLTVLKTTEREAAPLFQMLRSKYAPSLARDSSFELYLNKIGEVYFDLKAPQSMMNVITGLL